MKFASFYCPYESLYKILQTILHRKRFTISSASLAEGKIKALSEESLFKKIKELEVKIFKIDEHETRIMLMINSNPGVFDKPFSSDDLDEMALLEAINIYF